MRTCDRQPARTALHRALEAYVDQVGACDDTRQIQLLGTGAVAALEDRLRRVFGMRYALCVSSATAGLMVTALALGLRGAEFLAPPIAHAAAFGAWMVFGNRPRFADIDPETLTLDPGAVARRASRRTKAILAVDFHGVPADTTGLRQVADRLGLPYVADAAQSLGATVAGRPASSAADVLVTSFTAGKTIFAGEGGAVLTNDRHLYERLVWHGQHPYRQRATLRLSTWNEMALNARIHPLAAIWANATFEEGMRGLVGHRRRAFTLLDALDAAGHTEPLPWRTRRMEPAFFRVSLALRRLRSVRQVLALAGRRGRRVLQDRPLAFVSETPAFVAAWGRDPVASVCPTAADQVRRRLVFRLLAARSARTPPPAR
jgi:perosamine synthetase